MTPVNNQLMDVNNTSINVTKIGNEDYICLTDMARSYGADRVIDNWLRNKNTIEFLGIWEKLNNSSFNYHEFEVIKDQAGLNRFTISVKEWVNLTQAKGITAKTGRYGGTYAHRDIAFEFGTWLSPEFKLLIVTEFQRLKAKEQEIVEWDSRRYLSKINYRLHTNSIKTSLLPSLQLAKAKEVFIYTDEADVLNKIVFGQTAAEWRKANPELSKTGKNQRDFAKLEQLILLANLENLNAHFIFEGKAQPQRIQLLIDTAERQLQVLLSQGNQSRQLPSDTTEDQ